MWHTEAADERDETWQEARLPYTYDQLVMLTNSTKQSANLPRYLSPALQTTMTAAGRS